MSAKASFVPADGLIGIAGVLTPDCFVFSKDCHLSGGFAYSAWFAGEHEGDFVISVGGYSPSFQRPAHYPVVPRLALNWSIDSDTSVTGNLFYALTSSAVMAGGSLSAVWDIGVIRAWFSVEADFLLVFSPLHYHLSASCELGASFTIHLLFISFSITIHLGVGIEIRGPSFQGEADVDLSIISFTVRFGSSSGGGHVPLDFTSFVAQLLPKQDDATAAILNGTVAAGLLATPADTIDWVVDPHRLVLTLTSAIPAKNADPQSPPAPGPKAAQPEPLVVLPPAGRVQAATFGVGPCDVKASDFHSALTLAIHATSPGDGFHTTPILKNVPKALWDHRNYDGAGIPRDVDPLNGTTIQDVLVGWTLTPVPQKPDQTAEVETALLTTQLEAASRFTWSAARPAPIAPGPAPSTDIPTLVREGLSSLAAGIQATTAARARMLGAIASAGFAIATDSDVAELEQTMDHLALLDPPVSALLGQPVRSPIYAAQFPVAA